MSSDVCDLFTEWLDDNGKEIIEEHVDIQNDMEDAIAAAVGDFDIEESVKEFVKDSIKDGDYDEQIIDAVCAAVKEEALSAYFQHQDDKILQLEEQVKNWQAYCGRLQQAIGDLDNRLDKMSRPWYTWWLG